MRGAVLREQNLSSVTPRLAIGGRIAPDEVERSGAARSRSARSSILRVEACDDEALFRRAGLAFLHLPTEDHCGGAAGHARRGRALRGPAPRPRRARAHPLRARHRAVGDARPVRPGEPWARAAGRARAREGAPPARLAEPRPVRGLGGLARAAAGMRRGPGTIPDLRCLQGDRVPAPARTLRDARLWRRGAARGHRRRIAAVDAERCGTPLAAMPAGSKRHAALVAAFIEAGELVQGVADAECRARAAAMRRRRRRTPRWRSSWPSRGLSTSRGGSGFAADGPELARIILRRLAARGPHPATKRRRRLCLLCALP